MAPHAGIEIEVPPGELAGRAIGDAVRMGDAVVIGVGVGVAWPEAGAPGMNSTIDPTMAPTAEAARMRARPVRPLIGPR